MVKNDLKQSRQIIIKDNWHFLHVNEVSDSIFPKSLSLFLHFQEESSDDLTKRIEGKAYPKGAKFKRTGIMGVS